MQGIFFIYISNTSMFFVVTLAAHCTLFYIIYRKTKVLIRKPKCLDKN